jgi:hypothetical protein
MVGSSRNFGARVREILKGDFYEIPIDALGGYRPDRHSVGDFTVG